MIPIELFGIFLGISIVLLGVGISKKVGAIIVCSGIILLFVAVITDIIIMGQVVDTSVTSGSTTTYTYKDATFEFTEIHKVLMVIVGIFIMLIGALYYRE
jgi:cytochrome c biogenesis protein ResB